MAQKKKRDTVNFSNPKVKTLVAYMMLGENRVRKEEVLQIATKDILYQMKNAGYIKECSNGIYKGTSKLHKYVKEKDNKSFASSGSVEHSDKVRQSLNLLPKEVLQKQHSFTTSTDLEKQFKRYQKEDEYKERLENLKQMHRDRLDELKENHRSFYSTDEAKRYEENIIYEREREKCLISLQYLNDRVCLTPDYGITMSRGEVEQYLECLRSHRDELEDAGEYGKYTESIKCLESMITVPRDSYSFAVEITTDCYLNREYQLHRTWSVLTDMPLIFI